MEFDYHKTNSPLQKEFTEERSFDPPYRPSMATYDYRSSERRPTDQRIVTRFQRENEALHSATRTVDSPFTNKILNALSPRKFSMPIFILFDGTTDLIDHVYHIQLKMVLNTENDPLICKCFPTSLAGPVLNWFKNLPKGSVDSFRSLCDRFKSQYYGNKRPAKDISSLFVMKQHEDKRLQAFLTRFNLTKNMVIECHPFTAVQAFKLAMTRGTPFHTSLMVNTPQTMDKLNEKANGFVRLEEEEAANARKTSIISTKEKSKAKILQIHAPPQRQTSWKAQKRPREEELITPLKVTLVKPYQENKDKFRPPLPIRQPLEQRNQSKHCAFYSDFGHQTNECRNLRRQIEMLIAKEEFTGYVQGPAQEQNRPAEQIKRNQKPNYSNTHPVPHEDPLVVSLTVAECLVRRILIDLGSSANVMPRITFDWLEIEPKKLKPIGNPLLGFDRKRVKPIGMVELTVQAAERVLTKSFVAVEIHPSYNLLMGRGWIYRVQSVPSILHQVMRCLSPDKNVDVFAWSHSNMPGISPSVSYHSLNVDPNVKPVKQKQKRFAPERNQIIVEEIDHLLDAGFIREVQYPVWLSNVVVVVMLFGLKNDGALYQRLISKIFKSQMGRTVEAYIDDMVVKSKKKDNHLEHL
ncbi:uncharacterized protein LOC132304783 [Cornus florida]|uniref:uncharacterized protein LOC132304783 n=1 Tax=Cornus florida TaxID=4283 RepID=UPI00289A87B1|nr:uncharacterized protein LOC132304783 [Cornus florida]